MGQDYRGLEWVRNVQQISSDFGIYSVKKIKKILGNKKSQEYTCPQHFYCGSTAPVAPAGSTPICGHAVACWRTM